MIPEFDVEIFQKISTRWIGMPSEAILGFTDEEDELGIDTRALSSNHEYEDFRWLGWDDIANQIAIELPLLAKADTQSRNFNEFEEFCSEYSGAINDCGGVSDILHFDPGISALTAVTSAMGGAPMCSCRGHPRNNAVPGVAFYTTKKAAKIFLQYSKKFGCAIQHLRVEHYLPIHGLEIKARTVMPLLNMAQALYDNFHERDDYLAQLAQE